MSKISLYFKSQAEKDAYFADYDQIPSKFLVIVESEDGDVLYTTSNNGSATGKSSSQGGYIPSPEDEEKINDYDDALELSEYTLEGEDEEEEENTNISND